MSQEIVLSPLDPIAVAAFLTASAIALGLKADPQVQPISTS